MHETRMYHFLGVLFIFVSSKLALVWQIVRSEEYYGAFEKYTILDHCVRFEIRRGEESFLLRYRVTVWKVFLDN